MYGAYVCYFLLIKDPILHLVRSTNSALPYRGADFERFVRPFGTCEAPRANTKDSWKDSYSYSIILAPTVRVVFMDTPLYPPREKPLKNPHAVGWSWPPSSLSLLTGSE